MTAAKQKIFFSYSRADGSAFALRLAVDLKAKGFDVWIDQEDIKAGAEWDTEIEKALETCDCVLFLETEKSVVSHNVLDEVYYALEQKKKVIPLIYVDSKTPFRLKRLQHIDFTKDYPAGLAHLVNELNSTETALTYVPEQEKPKVDGKKPLNAKTPLVIGLVFSIAVLMAAVYFFTKERTAPVQVVAAAQPADTSVTLQKQNGALPDTTAAEAAEKKGKPNISVHPAIDKKANRVRKGAGAPPMVKTSPVVPATGNEVSGNNLTSLVAGNWRLTGVEPAAQSHRGYLKIDALDEGKATVKTYLQFYYPEKEASSYLTVFNAFAGCTACTIGHEMKLKTEDVAIGSRTIKKLAEDQPAGKKAGDVILDASANKSVGGTVSLLFVDRNTAIIRVKQSRSIALANELMLEPFEYIFRFKKID